MLCRLLREMPSGIEPGRILPAGHLVDHPDAYRLVQMGCAESVDVECDTAAAMTPEKTAAARFAFERTRLGIIPEDFEAYANGEMVGYFADGSWIPGPNAKPLEPSEFEREFLDV